MSGHGQGAVQLSRAVNVSPIESHTPQQLFLLAGSEVDQCRYELAPGPTDRVNLSQAPDMTLKTSGKRKWLLLQDDQGDAARLTRPDLTPNPSKASNRVACSLSRITQSSRKRPYQPEDSSLRPEWLFPTTSEDKASSNTSNDIRKRLYAPPLPCVDQHRHVVGHDDEPIFYDNSLCPPQSERCEFPQSELNVNANYAHWKAPGMGSKLELSMQSVPVRENEPSRRLSDLKWPFGDLVWGHETFRAPEGDTSKPGSTGSQGFPQFVTAGPVTPLSGSGLFGYEGDDCLGNILWA